jgi:alpha-mannosidase
MIVHMIGYGHLRPFGAWDWDAGRDEALATLRSAADRLDEYPGFCFTCGDLWALRTVERMDPELFKRVGKFVRRKRWSLASALVAPVDPWWVDRGTWEGLSAVSRQISQGNWGQRPQVYFQFDSAGLPARFLSMLLDAGFRSLLYCGPLPDSAQGSAVFRWAEATGGRELLCYCLRPGYRTRSHQLYGQIMEAVEAGNLSLGHVPCFYGIGNHGGGPSKENIEYILNHQSAFEGVELQCSTAEDFFLHAWMMSDSFPVHRGCIGSVGESWGAGKTRLRSELRRVGAALQSAASWVIDRASDRQMKRMGVERLPELWEDYGLCASVGATSLPLSDRADATIRGKLAVIERTCAEWFYHWSRQQSRSLPLSEHQQLVLCNPSACKRDAWVEWEPNLDGDPWGDRTVRDESDQDLVFQRPASVSGDPFASRLLFRMEVPAWGRRVLQLRRSPIVDDGALRVGHGSGLVCGSSSLSNGLLHVEAGTEAGFPFLQVALIEGSERRPLCRLQPVMDPMPSELPAPTRAKGRKGATAGSCWSLVEEGPLRASLLWTGMIGHSPLRWTVSLLDGDGRLRSSFRVCWRESASTALSLKALFHEKPLCCDPELQDGVRHSVFSLLALRLGNLGFGFVLPGVDRVLGSASALEFDWLVPSSCEVGDEALGSSMGAAGLEGTYDFPFTFMLSGDGESLDRELVEQTRPLMVMDAYQGMGRPPWRHATPVSLHEANERRALADGQMLQNGSGGVEDPV